MSACEKCWRDAWSMSPSDGVSVYLELVDSRKGHPCTPEEQAGDEATECPRCKRMTLHQHTGECMVPDCPYDESRGRFELTCCLCRSAPPCEESDGWRNRPCRDCWERVLGQPGVEPAGAVFEALKGTR